MYDPGEVGWFVRSNFLNFVRWFVLGSFVALVAEVHSVMSTSAREPSLLVSIHVVACFVRLFVPPVRVWSSAAGSMGEGKVDEHPTALTGTTCSSEKGLVNP